MWPAVWFAMMRQLANWLNQRGLTASDAGDRRRALCLYRWAARADPSWSVPWYNLALDAKYHGEWAESMRWNQRAVALNRDDADAWWNLAIAATALHEWAEARRAWKACGVKIDGSEGEECRMPPVTACVRVDPNGAGEVLWGERIDPARIVIANVPLPQSGRRFRDVVLNDGASNGTRKYRDGEVPVFDELAVWRRSDHSTYSAILWFADEGAVESLVDLCSERELGIEDWSSIRYICAECSRGNPGPHECKNSPDNAGGRRFAFAATSEEELAAVLESWVAQVHDAGFADLQVELAAGSA